MAGIQHADIDHTGLTGVGAGTDPQFNTIELGHASNTTIGRPGAGDISVEGNVVYRAGGTDVALADGGTGASLADPNADRIMFWDDSAGAVTWLTVGSNLTITTTTIDAAGGGGITRTTQGTTSPGASWQGSRGTFLKKLTLASAGLVASIVAHVKGDGSSLQGITAAVFADNAGAPGDLIAQGGASGLINDSSAYDTNVKISTTARDMTFPIGAWLASGDYWFAIRMFGGGDSLISLNYTGSGSDYDNTSASTTWTDHSIDSAASGSNNYTIYINVLR